jgi:hypothetical protein
MKIAIKTNKTVDITDLIPKFVMFFDASIPTTISLNGNKISQWLDRSLNGFHATQANISYQPTYASFDSFFGVNHPGIGGVISNTFLQVSIPANFPAIDGILYVATDRYIVPFPISIPSSTNSRIMEITSGTSGNLTGWILFNGTPTTEEDSRIINYLTIKGANSQTATSFNMEFCIETINSAYTNPILGFVTDLSSLLSANTSNVIGFNHAFRRLKTTQFPLIDTSSGTGFSQTWLGANLIEFPALNLSKAVVLAFAWQLCSNLVSFSAMDFRAGNNFQQAWQNCKLNAESVDNILISIAAGLANNPSKSLATNGGASALTGTNNSAPTNTNRRATNNWNSWEFNLSQINESISGTIYDFRNGITGQQAKNWLAAKGWAIATN